MRRACLLRKVFAIDILKSIFLKRNAWVATLLRTVVHEAVLADVEISGPGTASPIVRFSGCQVFLKPIEPGIALLTVALDLPINAFFLAVQRLHCPGPVMDNAQ